MRQSKGPTILYFKTVFLYFTLLLSVYVGLNSLHRMIALQQIDFSAVMGLLISPFCLATTVDSLRWIYRR